MTACKLCVRNRDTCACIEGKKQSACKLPALPHSQIASKVVDRGGNARPAHKSLLVGSHRGKKKLQKLEGAVN